MNKWVIYVGISVLFFSHNVLSFDTQSLYSSNEEVAAISESKQHKLILKELLADIENFKASFVQKILDNENNILQEASGDIVLAKPNRLRWRTQFPDETLLVADGNHVFNLDYTVEQLSIFDQQQIEQSNPLMLLISDEEEKWNEVVINKEKGNSIFIITSTDPQSTIKEVKLEFKESILTKISSLDFQGQVNQLSFSKISVNNPSDDALFHVVAPEGYVVDDQRSD